MSKSAAKSETPVSADSKLLESVPLDKIFVDRAFNPRQVYTGIRELGEDMKRNGQVTPIFVTTIPAHLKAKAGKAEFYLVSGFRRVAAMVEAKIQAAKAVFRPDMSEKDMRIVNLLENEARRELTTYERAMAFLGLSNLGMTGQQISDSIRAGMQTEEMGNGKSASYNKDYVNNLLRCVNKLHPTIIKAWKEGNPKAVMSRLMRLAGMKDHAEQIADWNESTGPATEGDQGGAGEDGAGEGGEGEGRATPKKRASEKDLEAALHAAKWVKAHRSTMAPDLEEESINLSIEVLRFALGKRATIPSLYDDKVKKAIEAAREEE